MSIPLVNKQKFKETFRVVDNPKLRILGLMHEPPEEIRYSNNMIIRMLEVSHNAINLVGKQIIHTGRSHAIYLIGSFVNLRNDRTYRCYEATHINQPWSRQSVQLHPVTKLPIGAAQYMTFGVVNVAVLHSAYPIKTDENPTQVATLISTDPIQPADIIGDFLIREVRMEYGLYFANAHYKTVSPNG